jgi:hypothetical protein
MKKKKQPYTGIGILVMTLLIYFITSYPSTKIYSFHLLIIFLCIFLGTFLFSRNNTNQLIYSATSSALFLVGISGWFFSPFFSWLYILAIALSFVYDQIISSCFIGLLISLLLPSVGSIDFTLNMLTVLSLFFIIPLTYFLHIEYLKLEESENEILILKEKDHQFKSVLNEVLSNKITKIAVQLRESLNDIKQIAYYQRKTTSKKQKDNGHEKIIDISEKGLAELKKFEEQVTGIKLVKTPK